MAPSLSPSKHVLLDDIMEEIGCGTFHVIAVFGLGCRMFARGSIMNLTAMLEPYFKCRYDLTYYAASFYVTLYLISSALTTPLTGWLADTYGRRKTLLLFSCMSATTAMLHVMSSSFLMVTLTMAAYGLFENGQYLVYPYLLEFFSKSNRKYYSALLIFYIAGWATSVLVGYYCLNYLSWRFTVIFCVILPLIPAIITFGYMPESPLYLIAIEDRYGAVKSLVGINKTNMDDADKQQLILKYSRILYDDHADDDDHNDDWSDESSLANFDDNWPSNQETAKDEDSLLHRGNSKISKKDSKQRIIVLCIIGFTISISQNALIYAAGQSYIGDSSGTHCSTCSTTVQVKHLISVAVGATVAAFVTCFIIGYVKRRLTMIVFTAILAVLMVPFYFQLSDWLLSVLFFIASVLTDSLATLKHVYCAEVMPSTLRGRASGFMSGFYLAGSVVAVMLATYFLHISHIYSFLFIHVCILTCLVVTYRYVIETKDMPLN